MFLWREQLTDPAGPVAVDWGFTAATPGGASAGDFAGFNLGDHVGDDPAAVEANRAALAYALDVDRAHLVFLNQVHGGDVAVANGRHAEHDGAWLDRPPAADGVVTTREDRALVVLVADCAPVLLADPVHQVVGAAHAGRPGLLAGIVPATVAAMRELGATAIQAVVGPSVCGRCYEVPAALRDAAGEVSSVSATVSWTGTPAIDVGAGVVDQLVREGVSVRWIPGCTRESARLYSYRRRSRTGRTAGVVRLWRP